MVEDLASALIGLGVRRGDRVLILARNSIEWTSADLAILSVGAVTVPLYETLSEAKAEFILKDSGARVAFAGTPSQMAMLNRLKTRSPQLKNIICFSLPFDAERKDWAMSFDEALEYGRDARRTTSARLIARRRGVEPDDVASIVYTSGTTGEPKGASLSHRNFVSNVKAALEAVPEMGHDDVMLSFLPLSHVLERTAGHFLVLAAGATAYYAQSTEQVPEDLLEVRPTVMIAVPRLYEKMKARIEATVHGESPRRQRIFWWAVRVGTEAARARTTGRRLPWTKRLAAWVADRLVFAKVRSRTGGRLRFFVSGGAHIEREIEELFWAAGLPILGGYGLTETSPVISVNTFAATRFGSVGKPLPGVEVRVADDGEILVRGPNVMAGYHNLPKETEGAFTEDGFFKTGDLGKLDADGFLHVTDRKKELIVMSTGKKVAPQEIENRLKASPLISEAVALGDGRSYVTALIVPDFEALRAWAEERGMVATNEALVANPQVVAEYATRIDAVNANLSKFEAVKRFALVPREFTQEDGELTPTLKVKRRVVAERFAKEIQALYATWTPA